MEEVIIYQKSLRFVIYIMRENTFTISDDYDGERLDKVLSLLIEDTSRNYIKSLIKNEKVLVDGEIVTKPSAKLTEGNKVHIEIPDMVLPEIVPQNIPLDILYEDDDVLVVNKPKGMVVHPAAGHYSGTLVNAVMYHCGDSLSGINGVLRPGIVHRIDRDTTGSIIICKNDFAHQSIAAQLKEHSITRKYYAIVYDNIPEDNLTIDKPIGRDPKERKKQAVVANGKRAVTHCHVLERFGDYTLVECQLETGRTHQIRVHMASIHHPLLGDEVYAGKRKSSFSTQGQCLHAGILGFIHPRHGEYIEISAPLPSYFEEIIHKLSKK